MGKDCQGVPAPSCTVMPAEYGLDSLCHAGINGKHDQGEICDYPVCCDTHVSLQVQNNHVKNNDNNARG